MRVVIICTNDSIVYINRKTFPFPLCVKIFLLICLGCIALFFFTVGVFVVGILIIGVDGGVVIATAIVLFAGTADTIKYCYLSGQNITGISCYHFPYTHSHIHSHMQT